jgi:hypothetical protein
MIFHLLKPDIPITEELTNFVVAAYNQAVTGLVKQLDLDLSQGPTG